MSNNNLVSEFLAREQEALGYLGSDLNVNDRVSSPNSPESYVMLNGANRSISPRPPIILHVAARPPSVSGSDTGPTTDVQHATNLYGSHNSYEDSFDNRAMQDDIYIPSSVRPESPVLAVPSQLDIWKLEFQKRIEEKDADEERLRIQLEESAKHELENWYKRYNEQLSSHCIDLRDRQGETESRSGLFTGPRPTVQDADVWEKVCTLCDFQAKPKQENELNRMRSILLSLKHPAYS